MDKHVAAMVLAEIGTLLDMLGENTFRARAFLTAARALDSFEGDLAEQAQSGALADVRGFGPATADVVRELVETGESRMHEQLRERTPSGLFELLAVPGLGAKRIHLLHETLGIESLADLKEAAESGRVAKLKGFGAKTEAKLLEGIAFVSSMSGRRRQPTALDAAGRVIGFLDSLADVVEVKLAGELRRRMETVDGIDVLCATRAPVKVVSAFVALPGLAMTERNGTGASARLADGLEVRLRCVPPSDFVSAWVEATGGASHWTGLQEVAASRGLTLTEDGLRRGKARVDLREEADLYAALELAWVAPELREGAGEIEAAAAGELPDIVSYKDLRGCFHVHTTYSDGTATVGEMAEAALARGWRYLGIADHSQAAHYAGGLSPARVAEQHAEIDAWNNARGGELWLFKGIESDILPDGSLDYGDAGPDFLACFDFVVGSVHGARGLDRRAMTARILKALDDPYLTFLGHATGRLLLTRNAYDIDMDAVIDRAIERGVAIEINADPARLDMDWRLWLRARGRGLRTAINPDAHSTRGLAAVEYGVGMARKGWVPRSAIVNTWELDEVKRYLGRKK